MTDSDKKQWIVMQCHDAWHDAQGNPGEHKIPLEGYDIPMTKIDALQALKEAEANRPDEDFSIRKIADVHQLDL